MKMNRCLLFLTIALFTCTFSPPTVQAMDVGSKCKITGVTTPIFDLAIAEITLPATVGYDAPAAVKEIYPVISQEQLQTVSVAATYGHAIDRRAHTNSFTLDYTNTNSNIAAELIGLHVDPGLLIS